MYNASELYELSFVAPQRRPRTKPRIVFTIKREHFDEVSRRLGIVADGMRRHADAYCSPETAFSYPAPDLFGKIEFGYGSCGYVVLSDESARFEIELSRMKLFCGTLTIKALTMALAVPADERKSNRQQQVDISMRCDHDAVGYGHAVGGYVSQRLLDWLRRHATTSSERYIPLPEDVVRAMRQAWSAVATDQRLSWTRDCGAYVAPDGRFSLNCFGNACDLAIYPDGSCGRMTDPYVQFGCHNLDSADQQITLLAGLAKLCEVARENE